MIKGRKYFEFTARYTSSFEVVCWQTKGRKAFYFPNFLRNKLEAVGDIRFCREQSAYVLVIGKDVAGRFAIHCAASFCVLEYVVDGKRRTCARHVAILLYWVLFVI